MSHRTCLRVLTATAAIVGGLALTALPSPAQAVTKLDIARSTCNDSWIHSAYTYIGLRSDGYPMYRAASGNVYTNEGSHWDIVYYTCGC